MLNKEDKKEGTKGGCGRKRQRKMEKVCNVEERRKERWNKMRMLKEEMGKDGKSVKC